MKHKRDIINTTLKYKAKFFVLGNIDKVSKREAIIMLLYKILLLLLIKDN